VYVVAVDDKTVGPEMEIQEVPVPPVPLITQLLEVIDPDGAATLATPVTVAVYV